MSFGLWVYFGNEELFWGCWVVIGFLYMLYDGVTWRFDMEFFDFYKSPTEFYRHSKGLTRDVFSNYARFLYLSFFLKGLAGFEGFKLLRF